MKEIENITVLLSYRNTSKKVKNAQETAVFPHFEYFQPITSDFITLKHRENATMRTIASKAQHVISGLC